MRRAVRAIVVKDNKLLVMERNKFGQQYVTLPGGNIEAGESLEQALAREVLDETSIQISNPKLRYIEHAGDPYGDQYIFSATYQSGEPKLHPDAEEERINKLGKNLYKPSWLAIDQLSNTPFMSPALKQHLMKALPASLPENPVEFSWQ